MTMLLSGTLYEKTPRLQASTVIEIYQYVLLVNESLD